MGQEHGERLFDGFLGPRVNESDGADVELSDSRGAAADKVLLPDDLVKGSTRARRYSF
jgi:hypothetical protein